MLRILPIIIAVVLVACTPEQNTTQTPIEKKLNQSVEASTTEARSELEKYIQNQRKRNFQFTDTYSADTPENNRGPVAQFMTLMGREDLVAPALSDQNLAACGESLGDPIEIIRERAAKTSIVILNEAHDAPLNRQFISDVLSALKQDGFGIYAAETFTFNYNDFPGTKGDAPTPWLSDGVYSQEPIFGRTVRHAKKLGYELVQYEQDYETQNSPEDAGRYESWTVREIAQATTLMSTIFTDRPDAKTIIHVGYGHIAERPREIDGKPAKSMALYLRERTGIDALTISQTSCGSLEGTTIAEALADGSANALGTDLMVGHPPLTFTKNRPDWRRALGDIDTAVPPEFLSHTEPVVIEARRSGETALSVPEDSLYLLPGETDIPLLLPPGTYRVEAFTKTGKVGAPVTLTVANP